ncbi:hypothetical protein CFP56_038244 [Quercus suber]|uniref:Uncharacterized protein n=1 Tax=Quercus suber TaxID=58331 RepID=A0AAW0LLX1_QUESU
MSVERSFEAWEEVQRHGQDFADRLAQGFTGLIQSHITPPSFPWPNPHQSKLFDLEFPTQTTDFLDIGNRIGQVGADFGAGLNGLLQQFFRRLPVLFRQEAEASAVAVDVNCSSRLRSDVGIVTERDLGLLTKRLRDMGFVENIDGGGDELVDDDEAGGFNLRSAALLGRPQPQPIAHCESNLSPFSTSPCILEAGECSNTLLGPLSSTFSPDETEENPTVFTTGLATPVVMSRSNDNERSLSVNELHVVSPVGVTQTEAEGVLSIHQRCFTGGSVEVHRVSFEDGFTFSSDRNSILGYNMLSGGLISEGKRLVILEFVP